MAETIGQKLRNLRGTKTQKEIADILNVTENYYWRMEKDKQKISRKVARCFVRMYGETEEYWRG